MQTLHQQIIRALEHCTFLPASYEKRFVRDMATLGEYDMLSLKQEALLEKLAWRYRKQIGRQLVAKPTQDVSQEETQRLEDWNSGKPLPGGMGR